MPSFSFHGAFSAIGAAFTCVAQDDSVGSVAAGPSIEKCGPAGVGVAVGVEVDPDALWFTISVSVAVPSTTEFGFSLWLVTVIV